MQKIKTVKEAYKVFREESLYWINKLGLQGWEVKFEEIKDEKSWARVRWNYKSQKAVIEFSTTGWQESDLNIEAVKKTALHEVLHLLLGILWDLAEERVWDEEEFEKETHTIINKLINVLTKRKGE